MEQSPIFVLLSDIAEYPNAVRDPEFDGRMDFQPRTLTGYRCSEIEAMYNWEPNGPMKGFSQTLMCRFSGRVPHFNYMARIMMNSEPHYNVMLPHEDGTYLVIGNHASDIDMDLRMVEHQTFVIQCPYAPDPFPYFDGEVSVTDCNVPELMERLYGINPQPKY